MFGKLKHTVVTVLFCLNTTILLDGMLFCVFRHVVYHHHIICADDGSFVITLRGGGGVVAGIQYVVTVQDIL